MQSGNMLANRISAVFITHHARLRMRISVEQFQMWRQKIKKIAREALRFGVKRL
jgi:hypothetical protein